LHLISGVKKKIKALAKTKDCELAGEWKRSIVNQIYWSATSTADGDGEVISGKYTSIVNHIRNVHTHDNAVYPVCQHAANYPAREWMTAGKSTPCIRWLHKT